MLTVNDDGAIHALGNGRLVVYGRGADIVHVFGEPYTTQPLLSGAWTSTDDAPPTYASERERGTSVWNHQFLDQGAVIATAQEFVVPDLPCYVMRLRSAAALTLTIELPEGYDCYPLAETATGTYDDDNGDIHRLIVAPDTARVLFYPVGVKGFLALSCWSEAPPAIDQQGGAVRVTFATGMSFLALAGGCFYPDVWRYMAEVRRLPYDELLARRYTADRTLTHRLRLPASDDAAIDALCEGTAFLITAQQSADGGIMAGHQYQLAYARDQYGACRGLLALGLHDEVRRNVDFRWRKWQTFGCLSNAESMGHDRIRHMHENDAVEQTAYTILQALDYAAATRDDASLARLWPMLDGCVAAQLPHLRDGLLPFNGDETYVAGGFLPRSALDDGSMEATLLFIASTRRLLAAARRLGLPGQERLQQYDLACGAAETAFRRHFLRGDVIVANAPERRAALDLPAYRHGVCEGCGVAGFGWTTRTRSGRYLCPRCAATTTLPVAARRVIAVNSSSLLPFFIQSNFLSARETMPGLQRAADAFMRQGYLATSEGSEGSTRSVGYDEGLLLYGLSHLHDGRAEPVFRHLISLVDTAGGWAEYYEHGRRKRQEWEQRRVTSAKARVSFSFMYAR